MIQGVHMPRAVEPSTARSRVEAEFIPNAQRVREDTTPRWQLGRYAFKKGADKLLVVSRITSFEDQPNPAQKRRGVKPRRFDKILERVWITIPLGTQLQEELKIEKLEERFHIGYDEGEINGEMWVQPNRVLGKVMLLNERPDAVDVLIDMRVEPKRLPSWSVQGILTVPVTQDGIRATRISNDLFERYRKAREVAAASSPPTADDEPPRTPVVVDTPPPPAPAPVPAADGDPPLQIDGAPVEPAEAKSIVGKWIGHAVRLEFLYQFDPDGTFVYSTRRPGAPPSMFYGTYSVTGDVVVIRIKRFEVGGRDHYIHVKDNPTRSLRISWTGHTLVLTGQITATGGNERIELVPTQFQNMNYVLPYSNE